MILQILQVTAEWEDAMAPRSPRYGGSRRLSCGVLMATTTQQRGNSTKDSSLFVTFLGYPPDFCWEKTGCHLRSHHKKIATKQFVDW